ncbi:MAG: UPF0280 family protein [Pirellulales bacterium]|nr:UPF0280 family protein [Pirellulales bacterium]
MMKPRIYRTFTHREAVFRISCDRYDAVTAEIIRQRGILEGYIRRDPTFRTSLEPITPLPNAPEIALRMARASQRAGVGPMAAVAGAMAQMAAEAGLVAGAKEAIVDNGGDIYLVAVEPVVVRLHTGTIQLADQLAFVLEADQTPLSICSSSGIMGHSVSLGACDLATIVAQDAALADAAATHAANLVRTVDDVNQTLEQIAAIHGIDGLLIVQRGHIGLAGRLPKLVKAR